MSFDIEFTGGLVDNRDLPQITTSSSLVKSTAVNALDSTFQMNFGSLPDGWEITNEDYTIEYSAFNVGFTSLDNVHSITGSTFICGSYLPNLGFDTVVSYMKIGRTLITDGAISWSVRWRAVSGDPGQSYTFFRRLNGNFEQEYIILSDGNVDFNTWTVSNFSMTFNAGDWLCFYADAFGIDMRLEIDYITGTIDGETVVDITPSTIVNGANKVGGTPIVPTITTVQDGIPVISGPANRFGLNVIDNGTTKLAPQFFPSALNTEESSATITEEKEITAESTSLSVEGTGLGGTEKLERGSSVIVEDVTSYGDN